MSRYHAPPLEHHIRIDATPAQVWALVSDVRRMPQWSPQVVSVELDSAFDKIELGARFINRNRHGDVEWETRAEIVRFRHEHEVAFRIFENLTIWSFSLGKSNQAGTRLTQRRENPDGISALSRDFANANLGGVEAFGTVLDEGAQQTLKRIKAAAEAEAAST